MEQKDKKTIVFLICPGRSGSTVFSKFLGMHSECFALSEPHFFDRQINADNYCSCEKRYSQCHFWQSVIYELEKESPINNFNTSSTQFVKNKLLISKLLKYTALYIYYNTGIILNSNKYFRQIKNEAILMNIIGNKLSEDIIVDGSKNAIRAIFLSRLLKDKFKSRFIILNRNAKSNVYSQIQNIVSFTAKGKKIDFKKENVPKIEEASKNWCKITRNYSIINKIFKLNALKIVYEDFAIDPRNEFIKIGNFLSLDWERSMLDLSQQGHHLMGGNMSRINATVIHPPKEEWRKLSKDEINKINKIVSRCK